MVSFIDTKKKNYDKIQNLFIIKYSKIGIEEYFLKKLKYIYSELLFIQ